PHKYFVYNHIHRFEIVYLAYEHHAFIAERDSGIGETFDVFLHFNGQLARMVYVHAHPERMIFRKHRAKLRRDPLWQENRDARADPEKLDVRNRAQAAQNFLELIVAENERVAAAQKHVAHFGVLFEVAERFLEIGVQFLFANAADHAAPCAISAIGSAAISHQKQHAV